ncbi:MAG: hypothetical protein GXP63_02575 [DPANN group archaeon]|nr:hypothetical protein [DPANN group archaeon]
MALPLMLGMVLLFSNIALASSGSSLSGTTTVSNTQVTIEGAGDDIWNNHDYFRYFYRAASGDFDIYVKVKSLEDWNEDDLGWAKAGLMFRASLDDDAKNVYWASTVSKLIFQKRAATGGTTSSQKDLDHVAPIWLRLKRTGNVFDAYFSSDGASWTSFSSASVSMPTTLYVGMAVTSNQPDILFTAVFDQVHVSDTNFTSPPSGNYFQPGQIIEAEDGDLQSPMVMASTASPVDTSAPPVCGDNMCEGNEQSTCPDDCPGTAVTSTDLYGSRTSYACDYYASPDGESDGRSESGPFRIADFWGVAEPGDTLCLLDGTYKGINSMIQPPSGLSGTDGNPIRVVALHDGQAFIDGEGKHGPVSLDDAHWLVFEGFNAHSAKTTDSSVENSVAYMTSSDNIVFRRIVGWDSKDANTAIFEVGYHSKNVLIEDSAGFGIARKIFGQHWVSNTGDDYDERITESAHNIFRRVFGRSEKSSLDDHQTCGQGVMTVGYNSNDNLIENGIATIDGYLGTDLDACPGTPHNMGFLDDRQYDMRNQILGSISYRTSAERVGGTDTESLFLASSNHMKIRDILVVVEDPEDTYGQTAYGQIDGVLLEKTAEINRYNYDLDASYLTFIGGPGTKIKNNDAASINTLIVQGATWNEDKNTIDDFNEGFVPATGLWAPITSQLPPEYVMFWDNTNNYNHQTAPEHYSVEDPDLVGRFGNLLQYGTGERPKVDGEAVGAQIACRYEDGVLTVCGPGRWMSVSGSLPVCMTSIRPKNTVNPIRNWASMSPRLFLSWGAVVSLILTRSIRSSALAAIILMLNPAVLTECRTRTRQVLIVEDLALPALLSLHPANWCLT